MEERRKSSRLELNCTILLKRLDDDKPEKVDIQVFDLSKTGMGFVCDEPLENGSLYNTYLTIWTKETIQTCIQIVRNEKKEDGFHYGAAFVGMSETDAARIEVYQTVKEYKE